jgi:nucleotide-binding universal stress UspA family protein
MGDIGFATIVVPFDFSPASERALRVATAFAESGHSNVVLLNVVERPLYPDVAYSNIPAAMAEERRDRDVRLARVAHRHPRTRAVVREGAAKEEIVACARAERADVIVIGRHAAHGLEHWLRGSVVEHVVANAPCDVLVVRSDQRHAERAA